MLLPGLSDQELHARAGMPGPHPHRFLLALLHPSSASLLCMHDMCTHNMIACAGSVGSTQLAQLFTNLGNPLPYDKLSAIMQQYDVSKSGAALQEPD